MGDGTKESPYTREDVLRFIKEHGGTADGLDLTDKWFKDGIDLKALDLSGIILRNAILYDITLEDPDSYDPTAGIEGAHLEGSSLMEADLEGAYIFSSHLEGTDLFNANLRNALLTGAHLEGANLSVVNLDGTKMRGANLEGALLAGVKLSSETILADVKWGNYILREEMEGIFTAAGMTYRQLKMWHSSAGIYDVAGEFYYREMEAKRKQLHWWPNPLQKIRQTLYWLLCGYGEKPWRVVTSALVVVLGLALIYFVIGTLTPNSFVNSLYYSAVSFTALGYGSWAPEPTGWVKGLGAFEAFLGVFMMALFLVTFTRKMTR